MSRSRRDRRGRLSVSGVPGEPGAPVPVGDAAAIVGAELGLGAPWVLCRLVTSWPEIVGPVLAAHSRVGRLRGTVLDVGVDAPAWATEVRYLADEVVERVSRLVGPGIVTALRVSVDPARAPDAAGSPPTAGRREKPGSAEADW